MEAKNNSISLAVGWGMEFFVIIGNSRKLKLVVL